MSTAEPIRLNKALARAGLASRREADRLIRDGHVKVNGDVVREMGVIVTPGRDRLELDGRNVALSAQISRRQFRRFIPPNPTLSFPAPEKRHKVLEPG